MNSKLALFFVTPHIQTERDAYNILLGVFVLVVVPSVLLRFHRVMKRRRKGEAWNEALAEGTKLSTGNVWLDGVTLLAVALVTYAVVWLILTFA